MTSNFLLYQTPDGQTRPDARRNRVAFPHRHERPVSA